MLPLPAFFLTGFLLLLAAGPAAAQGTAKPKVL